MAHGSDYERMRQWLDDNPMTRSDFIAMQRQKFINFNGVVALADEMESRGAFADVEEVHPMFRGPQVPRELERFMGPMPIIKPKFRRGKVHRGNKFVQVQRDMKGRFVSVKAPPRFSRLSYKQRQRYGFISLFGRT